MNTLAAEPAPHSSHPDLDMPRYTAVVTHKGGVGKTTTVANLAGAFVGKKELQKVLVLDFDSQIHCTLYLLGDTEPGGPTIADALTGRATVAECVRRSPHSPHLWVLPGSRALADAVAEAQTQGAFDRNVVCDRARTQLRTAIDAWRDPEDGRPFDLVLIDTAPSLELWTQIGITLADGAIAIGVPGRLEKLGVWEALDFAEMMRQQVNPDLRFDGVVLARHRPARGDDQEYKDLYEEEFGNALFAQVVPEMSVISVAANRLTPLEFMSRDYSGASVARTFYRELARELRTRWSQ